MSAHAQLYVVSTHRRDYPTTATNLAQALAQVRYLVHGSAPADTSKWIVRTGARYLREMGVIVD